MERVNLWGFYFLGMSLHPVGDIKVAEGTTIRDVFTNAFAGQQALNQFVSNESVPLGVSKEAAKRLIVNLNSVLAFQAKTLDEFRKELDKPLNCDSADMITKGVSELETLMANELPRLDIYAVGQKGIYSTPALIERAEMALAEDVRAAISDEARKDLNQSGRCLAFELSTAAGYHAMRATERGSREYYSLLINKRTTDLGMKQCIDELRKAGADAKTMGVLDQLRELHRNPLDHPEIFLETTEAQELFDIAKSAISAMGRQIAKIKTALKALPAAPAS